VLNFQFPYHAEHFCTFLCVFWVQRCIMTVVPFAGVSISALISSLSFSLVILSLSNCYLRKHWNIIIFLCSWWVRPSAMRFSVPTAKYYHPSDHNQGQSTYRGNNMKMMQDTTLLKLFTDQLPQDHLGLGIFISLFF
jgi:hypothetical protein